MMRPMKRIPASWLGRTDLRAVTDSDQVGIGPIDQALGTGRFSRLELLCDYPSDEVDAYLDWLRSQSETRIVPHPVTLPSPTDFDAIYRNARAIAALPPAAPAFDAIIRQSPVMERVVAQDVRQCIDLNGIIDWVARHYLE